MPTRKSGKKLWPHDTQPKHKSPIVVCQSDVDTERERLEKKSAKSERDIFEDTSNVRIETFDVVENLHNLSDRSQRDDFNSSF